jgi:hypothetical protein
MINEFTKMSDQMKIDKPGYLFDSPRECFEHFIKMVDETGVRNRALMNEVEEIGREIKKIREKNELYCKLY